MPARRWSDLPPDLAREISGRLHDATDLVRFHAVCRPWRGSWSPAAAAAVAATTTTRFLPWLLAAVKQDSTRFEMRCVLSNSNYRSQPLLSEPSGNWLTSPNGTALLCLTIQHLCPSLHDLLTGAITHLPLLPHDLRQWEKIKPRGVIYGDGTTLLYSVSYSVGPRTTARFRAALLRPGDAEWTIIKRALERITWSPQHGMCVAYHGGKILLIMKAGIWRLITPETDDVLVRSQGMPVVQEISKRSQEQQQQIGRTISGPPTHTLRIERHRVPSYRLVVCSLPLTVKSTQLRIFFSEHGEVSSAEVMCYKKTGASQGIGHVTIQMTHAHEEDARAALTGLVLDGCRLEVRLVKEGQPRRHHRRHV
ncbi:hypothetical protein VPH35_048305 [Triticum aestivum]